MVAEVMDTMKKCIGEVIRLSHSAKMTDARPVSRLLEESPA